MQLRRLGDDEPDKAIEGSSSPKEGWMSVPNPDGVVREVKERRVVSREETEERRETEDIKHLGDITDEVNYTNVKILAWSCVRQRQYVTSSLVSDHYVPLMESEEDIGTYYEHRFL